ncbi:hypothetical protein NST21_22575 [Peribacillus sp. FSL K6-1552]|uniref:hypothetical protein n=1 Tax=Peribacillus sp. FSL K6-1552 TaxID=2954514 RepID=UPI0030FBEAE1
MKEEVLMLKIHNGLKDGKDYYEATRGNWKVNKKRFDHIKYVIGINRGKVICAFEPIRWKTVEVGSNAGRKNFEGVEATTALLSTFQHNEDLLMKKFGRGQSVAYAYMTDIYIPY